MKKVTFYLFVTKKCITFAAEINKNEKMKHQNLLNGLIIIRLQSAAGSDKVYVD